MRILYTEYLPVYNVIILCMHVLFLWSTKQRVLQTFVKYLSNCKLLEMSSSGAYMLEQFCFKMALFISCNCFPLFLAVQLHFHCALLPKTYPREIPTLLAFLWQLPGKRHNMWMASFKTQGPFYVSHLFFLFASIQFPFQRAFLSEFCLENWIQSNHSPRKRYRTLGKRRKICNFHGFPSVIPNSAPIHQE